MEPQVNINCKRPQSRNCCCIMMLISLFAILLSFAIGALIGAVTGLVTFISVGAFVVLLTLLAVALLALIIFYLCKECRMEC